MAYTYTLTALKSAIQEWLEDDGTEFQTALTNIINLAEIQLIKDLDFTIFDKTATGTASAATISVPSDYIRTISLLATVSGQDQVVTSKPWDYLQVYGGTGTPLYFNEVSETTISLAPVPTSTAYKLRYLARPTPLTETTSTWLSENVPDCLFWGCIVASEHFRKADERINAAKGFYKEAVEKAKQELRHLVRREYS